MMNYPKIERFHIWWMPSKRYNKPCRHAAQIHIKMAPKSTHMNKQMAHVSGTYIVHGILNPVHMEGYTESARWSRERMNLIMSNSRVKDTQCMHSVVGSVLGYQSPPLPLSSPIHMLPMYCNGIYQILDQDTINCYWCYYSMVNQMSCSRIR